MLADRAALRRKVNPLAQKLGQGALLLECQAPYGICCTLML